MTCQFFNAVTTIEYQSKALYGKVFSLFKVMLLHFIHTIHLIRWFAIYSSVYLFYAQFCMISFLSVLRRHKHDSNHNWPAVIMCHLGISNQLCQIKATL